MRDELKHGFLEKEQIEEWKILMAHGGGGHIILDISIKNHEKITHSSYSKQTKGCNNNGMVARVKWNYTIDGPRAFRSDGRLIDVIIR